MKGWLLRTKSIQTNGVSACACCPPPRQGFMLSQSQPCNSRARTIIFFLQAPFKFSLFKSRINLPFVLALTVELESSPMTSLITERTWQSNSNSVILWPSVVFICSTRGVGQTDGCCRSAAQSHLQQKGSTCIGPLFKILTIKSTSNKCWLVS